tara:strand:+ start:154 stop:390 length:237 start_codon:yes stop_codon:yes gene_type:complete
MTVKIEKGVPIGEDFRLKENKFVKALQEMEVGDSFLIDESEDDHRSQLQNITYHAKKMDITIKGIKEDERSRRIHRVE